MAELCEKWKHHNQLVLLVIDIRCRCCWCCGCGCRWCCHCLCRCLHGYVLKFNVIYLWAPVKTDQVCCRCGVSLSGRLSETWCTAEKIKLRKSKYFLCFCEHLRYILCTAEKTIILKSKKKYVFVREKSCFHLRYFLFSTDIYRYIFCQQKNHYFFYFIFSFYFLIYFSIFNNLWSLTLCMWLITSVWEELWRGFPLISKISSATCQRFQWN